MLLRWATDNLTTIKDAEPEVPQGFANRLSDNWRILSAIADQAGLGDVATKAASKLSQRDDEASLSTQLLVDCQTVMQAAQVDRMKSADLVAALVDMEERPWAEMPGSPASRSPRPSSRSCSRATRSSRMFFVQGA